MKIRIYEHPLAVVEPSVITLDDEPHALARWLLDHYGPSPQFNIEVYEGEPSAEAMLRTAEEMLAADGEVYTVLQSPGIDPISQAAIISALINAAVGLAISFGLQLLFPPQREGALANVNRNQESPNNQLSARENQVRLLQRVEDIYGTVKAIPSLMMPTYNKYIDHRRVEYGYYCVGRGYYALSNIQDGDTLISQLDGCSAAVYHPFTSPNNSAPYTQIGPTIIDQIMTVRRSAQVDGLTLQALNQINVGGGTFVFSAGGMPPSGELPIEAYPTIWQEAKAPNFNSVSEVGQTVSVAVGPLVITNAALGDSSVIAGGLWARYTDTNLRLFIGVQVGDSVTFAGFTDPNNNGTFTVTAVLSASEIEVNPVAQVNEAGAPGVTLSYSVNYDGTYTISAVGDGFIGVAGAPFRSRSVPTPGTVIVNNGTSDWTAWYTLPDTDRTEVWLNIVAPQGLYKDNGGRAPTGVAYQAQVEQLNGALVPTGLVETYSSSLTGRDADERAETLEHITAWTGPARVRMRRLTPYDYAFPGLVVDEIKWQDLYAVSPVSKGEFGNKTTIHTVTPATPRATAARTRQLNCIAARGLPILLDSTPPGGLFSGAFDADGRLVSGAIYPTSRIVDILAAVSVDPTIGARNLATDVDLGQIAAVQAELDAWSASAGQFNYTFDSTDTSYEETVVTIANAAFCAAYRQSGKIRLAFDKAQTSSTRVFTHRNKKPRAETILRTFATDANYDGIELTYQDPDSQQAEVIRLPLDDSALKYKPIEIAGIRNFTQAWYRANREYRKLLGQRVSIETDVTTDARVLLPNSRIDIVDNTRFKSYDGEVVAQSGLVLTLSRDVEFTPGQPHSIILMKRDGTLQAIAVTPGPQARQVVLAGAPAEAIVTTVGAEGIRTIFSFAADSDRGKQAYLLQEMGSSDGQYIRLRAVNYSADYYAADYLPVPPKDTVIN